MSDSTIKTIKTITDIWGSEPTVFNGETERDALTALVECIHSVGYWVDHDGESTDDAVDALREGKHYEIIETPRTGARTS